MGQAEGDAVGPPVRPGWKVGIHPGHGLRALMKGRRAPVGGSGILSLALRLTPPSCFSGSSFLSQGLPFLSRLPTCTGSGGRRRHFSVCCLCLLGQAGHIPPMSILHETLWVSSLLGAHSIRKERSLSCPISPSEDRVVLVPVRGPYCYLSCHPSRCRPVTLLDSSLDPIFRTAPYTFLWPGALS